MATLAELVELFHNAERRDDGLSSMKNKRKWQGKAERDALLKYWNERIQRIFNASNDRVSDKTRN